MIERSRSGYRFERRERRFLVDDADELTCDLQAKGFSLAGYRVRTLYLEAIGPSRIRLREYDESEVWWLEHKVRSGDLVRKIRHRLGPLQLSGVETTGVTYRRTALERFDLRITVDHDLRSDERLFPGVVVEIKGELPKTLRIDLPPEDIQFSKFAWLSGRYR